ncbi:hypothetical protein [Flavobacterium covae]|uniref:hypothetical protein n=1 Tax=Flavobacterium covae TaxID=2906076 RepID=UPI000745EA1B|nr:hypothetical protein [Flavobacterium covae]AMA50577.1 hypothetical protein AWN65_14475 [Flavobacterium covae]MCJ1810346.1 hypothetical protein [Flavobacterium covae]
MKKNIFYSVLLTITFFSSCKKSEKINNEKVNPSQSQTTNLSIGDSIIANSGFVDELKSISNPLDRKKLLKKISFDYEKYSSWDYKKMKNSKLMN